MPKVTPFMNAQVRLQVGAAEELGESPGELALAPGCCSGAYRSLVGGGDLLLRIPHKDFLRGFGSCEKPEDVRFEFDKVLQMFTGLRTRK